MPPLPPPSLNTAPPSAPPQSRSMREGPGWRLGWDPTAPEYQGLVAGAEWSLELTAAELDDFCRLLAQLAQTMEQMATELMAEERLCCEAESDRLWLEVEGFPAAYTLRLMLLSGRRGEGSWSIEAVPGLVQAAQTLGLF